MFPIKLNWPKNLLGRTRKDVAQQKRPIGRPRKDVAEQKRPIGRPRKDVAEQKRPTGRPRKYFLSDNTNIGLMLRTFFEMKEPLSDYDLEILLSDQMDINSVRPCRLRLQRLGRIQPCGHKIYSDKSRPYRTYVLKGV